MLPFSYIKDGCSILLICPHDWSSDWWTKFIHITLLPTTNHIHLIKTFLMILQFLDANFIADDESLTFNSTFAWMHERFQVQYVEFWLLQDEIFFLIAFKSILLTTLQFFYDIAIQYWQIGAVLCLKILLTTKNEHGILMLLSRQVCKVNLIVIPITFQFAHLTIYGYVS